MKRILCVVFLVSSVFSLSAQNNLGSTDDVGRIILTAMVPEDSPLPANTQKMMLNKLSQIASSNGIGGTGSMSNRFFLSADVIVLESEVTPTSPPITSLRLSPTLYVGDAETGALFASLALPPVKCAGATTDKAFMAGLKNIKTTSPEITAFVQNGKKSIIEYYNSQIDFILSKAKAIAKADTDEGYDEAICMLCEVPEVCKEAYEKAMDLVSSLYKQKIDKESGAYYNQAYALWNTTRDEASAKEASELLGKVNFLSSFYPKAQALSKEIVTRFKNLEAQAAARRKEAEERKRLLEDRAWEHQVKQDSLQNIRVDKQMDNEHTEQMATIEAARQVGIQFGKQKQPKQVIKIIR